MKSLGRLRDSGGHAVPSEPAPSALVLRLLAALLVAASVAACGPPEEAGGVVRDAEYSGGGLQHPLERRRGLELGGLPAGQVAFNPGLLRHRGQLISVFRIEQFGTGGRVLGNRLAAVRLDEDQRAQGSWAYLTTPRMLGTADTAEDPRLVEHQGRVWVVYTISDNGERMGPRRIHLAELLLDPTQPPSSWRLGPDRRLVYVPPRPDGRLGMLPRIEKNWSPFVYDNALHFLYRSNPIEVLRVDNEALDSAQRDIFPARVEPLSQVRIPWGFGEVRGGTPAIWEPGLGRYVTFFHSRWVCRINGNARKEHYFTGYYSFRPEPPFDIDKVYSKPLAFPVFVEQAARKGGQAVVYVEGAVADGNRYLLSYGLGDASMGVMEVDRDGLLSGLDDPRALPGPPFSVLDLQVDPVCDR